MPLRQPQARNSPRKWSISAMKQTEWTAWTCCSTLQETSCFSQFKPCRYSVRFELSAMVLDSAEQLEHTSQQLDWRLPQSGN